MKTPPRFAATGMKSSRNQALVFLLALGCISANAATLYWDQNGATPGFQTTSSTGTWTTSAFWSADATGSTAGSTFTSDVVNTDAVFASGIANVANTIAVGGTQAMHSLAFQNSRWALTGTGTITLGTGGLTYAVPIGGTASGNTTFATGVTFTLAGSQTWTNNANNATNLITVAGAVNGTATAGNTQTLTLTGGSGGSGIQFTGVIGDGAGGGTQGIIVNSPATVPTGTGSSTYQITGLANTYTGQTQIQKGALQVALLANAGTNSSLGKGTANSVIDLGAAGQANNAGIVYNGATASSTNRVINLAGNGGTLTINNASSTAANTLTLTSDLTVASGSKTLALGGSNTGDNSILGKIVDPTASGVLSVVKSDAGTWVLGGNNTFTGALTVNSGVLKVNGTNTNGAVTINTGSTLSLGAGGTIGTGAISLNGGNLLLGADTNIGAGQAITIGAGGGGIGVTYNPTFFPNVTDNSGTTGGIYGIGYTGTGGIGSFAGVDALFTSASYWFLGAFTGTTGTFTGTSLTAGNGNNYRLGGGGGALTIQNNILVGANNLVVGSTGGGSVTLSNGNTYTGTTTIQNGTLNVASLNSVVGGTSSSSLGAPTSLANGTINLGSGTNVVGLNYTGAGASTDRVLNFAGTTGGVTLGNSGTGAINYTSTPTFTGSGAKIISLGSATDTVGGSIGNLADSPAGATGVTKQGLTNSRWILGGANTYTGTTLVSGGVLQTSALPATSTLTLAGTATGLAIYQSNGLIARAVGTSPTNAAVGGLNWGNYSGFAAVGGALTLDLTTGVTGNQLFWSGNFAAAGANILAFGSTTADSRIELKNSIALGTSTTGLGTARTIFVEKGVGGDSALLSGAIVDASGGATANGGQSITKTGAGTLVLSGANRYTGATNVSAGKLLINGDNSLATGAVTVASGATLGGNGIVGGATTVSSGGILRPGETEIGTGLLRFGDAGSVNVTLAAGSNVILQINGTGARGVAYSAIDVTGNQFGQATLGVSSLFLNFGGFLADGSVLDLFGGNFASVSAAFNSVTLTGLYVGSLTSNGQSGIDGAYVGTINGQQLSLNNFTGDLSVTGSAIPEPATYAMLVGGAILAGAWHLRRRHGKQA